MLLVGPIRPCWPNRSARKGSSSACLRFPPWPRSRGRAPRTSRPASARRRSYPACLTATSFGRRALRSCAMRSRAPPGRRHGSGSKSTPVASELPSCGVAYGFPLMALRRIRTYGDPVLTQPALPVRQVDSALRRLAEDMIETMYDAPGVGLAGPQVGVQLRIFVYDAGEGPHTVINPVLSAHSGEWEYEEGCLSVPGYYWPIQRPSHVHLEGQDLEGN